MATKKRSVVSSIAPAQIGWSRLPICEIVQLNSLAYALKVNVTAEEPMEKESIQDHHKLVKVTHYRNRAGKLVGYVFHLKPKVLGEDKLPHTLLRPNCVWAHYVTGPNPGRDFRGTLSAVFHDSFIRIGRTSHGKDHVYQILLRYKPGS